jgi:hypothetical protein
VGSSSEKGKGRETTYWERGKRRGWLKNGLIPVPMKLFVKRATRTFVVVVKVQIRSKDGEGEEVMSWVEGKAEMSASHLRKSREIGLQPE